MTCAGAETRLLDELVEFQGELKTLSPENAARLRREILELGFSEPISVWQHDGTCYILNGHQRVTVLRGMAASEDEPGVLGRQGGGQPQARSRRGACPQGSRVVGRRPVGARPQKGEGRPDSVLPAGATAMKAMQTAKKECLSVVSCTKSPPI